MLTNRGDLLGVLCRIGPRRRSAAVDGQRSRTPGAGLDDGRRRRRGRRRRGRHRHRNGPDVGVDGSVGPAAVVPFDHDPFADVAEGIGDDAGRAVTAENMAHVLPRPFVLGHVSEIPARVKGGKKGYLNNVLGAANDGSEKNYFEVEKESIRQTT